MRVWVGVGERGRDARGFGLVLEETDVKDAGLITTERLAAVGSLHVYMCVLACSPSSSHWSAAVFSVLSYSWRTCRVSPARLSTPKPPNTQVNSFDACLSPQVGPRMGISSIS